MTFGNYYYFALAKTTNSKITITRPFNLLLSFHLPPPDKKQL